MSRWWRAYDEAVDHPKLGTLSDKLHRAWFNLMCIASANGGVLPAINAVAFKLRVAEHKATELITALVSAGLFDLRADGRFEPHNWNSRQYKSDVTDPTNAKRQKRYRDRHRVTENGVTETVTVTPPRVQRQNTETDSSLRSLPRKRGEAIPADWVPSEKNRVDARAKGLSEQEIDREGERFRDHSLAKGVLHKNVDAAWRNWVTSPYQARAPVRANGATPRPGSKEDMRERTHHALQKLSDYVDAHADDKGGSGGAGEADVGLLPLAKPARS